MFTGIVEENGTVASVRKGINSAVLTVYAKKVLEGTKLGDSIAVNGVCLTVTALSDSSFSADVMHETLDRSSLKSAVSGTAVNLERAMAADGRFGGHIVSGHIDGTGTITDIRRDDNAIWYTVSADSSLMRYIVEKGSIAVDGISLTVARVGREDFSVSVIPHTARHTILGNKKTGDTVNLENDIIAKYVEKLTGGQSGTQKNESRISRDFLMRNGFMTEG